MKFIPFISLFFILICCSTQRQVSQKGSIESLPQFEKSEAGDEDDNLKKISIENRQMVYQAHLELVYKTEEGLKGKFEEIAKNNGGYIALISQGRVEMRVSQPKLETAIEQISALGKVKERTITGRDVTEEHKDLTIRLQNAEKLRERYLQLLAKAEKVEEMLKIEKELERQNTEIDRLKGKLQVIEKDLALSLIVVNLREKVKPGLLGYVFIGLYESVKWIFVRN